MTGRVCEKHECYCPDGVCRWCAPPHRDGTQFVVPFSKDFVKCHCGEYMFDTRMVPPGMPLEGVGPGYMHTPAHCTKNPSLLDVARRRGPAPDLSYCLTLCGCGKMLLPPGGGQYTMGPNGVEEHHAKSCTLPAVKPVGESPGAAALRDAKALSDQLLKLESKRFYFHGVPVEIDPNLGPDEFRWVPWDGKSVPASRVRKMLDAALADLYVLLAKMDQE